MKLEPQNFDGQLIAVFIWDLTNTCGGSAVIFGKARFRDNEFYVERRTEPYKLQIPQEAWGTLREVDENDEEFAPATVMVMLRLGPLPEDADESQYEEVNIPILKTDSMAPNKLNNSIQATPQ